VYGDAQYSAASCRGLIEGIVTSTSVSKSSMYSAASCRGLIEGRQHAATIREAAGIPRLRAAASLKESGAAGAGDADLSVFRGFVPRPH